MGEKASDSMISPRETRFPGIVSEMVALIFHTAREAST